MTAKTHADDPTPETGAIYQVFSASQIDTFLDCRRKWAWDKIARIPRPSNASAALGDRCHHQLETYLDGGPFDFTEKVNGVVVADIAASGVHLLPAPCAPYEGSEPETPQAQRARHAAHGMSIEGEFRWQAPKTNYVYTGRKDLQLTDSGLVPDLEVHGLEVDENGRTGVPAIIDHKTTSSFNYVKDADVLAWDVQAVLYAYDLIASTGADKADLFWIYYKTRGGKDAKRVHLRMSADDARARFAVIETVARDMATIRDRAPKFSNAPRDRIEGPPDMGHEWRTTLAAFVEQITPNADACEKYGGCSYRHMCRLTPAEGQFRFMSNEKKDPIVDSLKKRAAAQDAAAGLPPTCAPTEVPAPATPPAWTTAPVDPMSLRKQRTPASAPKPEPLFDGQVAADRGVAACEPVAINPPESKLPPPVLPPEPASKPSLTKGHEQASADTPAEPRRRGRPKGSKNAAKDPEGADVALHTKADEATCTTQGDASEPCQESSAPDTFVDDEVHPDGKGMTDTDLPLLDAVKKSNHIVATYDVTEAVKTAIADAKRLDAKPGAFFLFVDCIPLNVEAYELVDKYIEEGHAIVRSEADVADYRFLPFGQGPGALAVATAACVKKGAPSSLFLSTSSPEGQAVLSSLASMASLVVRGCR